MIIPVLLISAFTINVWACDIPFHDKSGKVHQINSKESIQALKNGTSLIAWLKVVKEENGFLFFEVRKVIKGFFPFTQIALSKTGTKGPVFQIMKANLKEPLFGTYSNHKNFDHNRQRMSDCTLTKLEV